MADEISDWVRDIAEARGLPATIGYKPVNESVGTDWRIRPRSYSRQYESEVFERTLKRGLEDPCKAPYSRSTSTGNSNVQAIEHVGRTKVDRAEQEREVVEEDVGWDLNA